MNIREIEHMWKVASNDPNHDTNWHDPVVVAFAKLVAEKEREVVANWIMDRGFATGHGDSIVDLLDQLEWQIAEREREACAKIFDEVMPLVPFAQNDQGGCLICGFTPKLAAKAIRARGQA